MRNEDIGLLQRTRRIMEDGKSAIDLLLLAHGLPKGLSMF